MRRVALELLPARDSSLLQFFFATDDLEGTAFRAIVDGQRQAPVAFLGDHPIVHVAQPVQLALKAKGRDPGDLAEDQFGLTAPAGWVAMPVVLWAVEHPFLCQVLRYLFSHVVGA